MPYNYVDSASNFCCIIMLRVQCLTEKVFDLLLFYVNLLQCVGRDNCGIKNYIVMLCDIKGCNFVKNWKYYN